MTAQEVLEADYAQVRVLIKKIRTRVQALGASLYSGNDEKEYLEGWDYVMTYCRTPTKLIFLQFIDRLLGTEYPELHAYVTIDDYIRYHPAVVHDDITLQHLDAFWTLRDALYEQDASSHVDSKSELLDLVLQEPSRAAVMITVVLDRGVIDPETMLGLLEIIGTNPTALVDGVL